MLNTFQNIIQIANNKLNMLDISSFLSTCTTLVEGPYKNIWSSPRLEADILKQPNSVNPESLSSFPHISILGSTGDDSGVLLGRIRHDFALMDEFNDSHLNNTYYRFYETTFPEYMMVVESEIRIRSYLDAVFTIMNSSDCLNITPLYKIEFPELWQDRVSTILRSIVWHNQAVQAKPGDTRIKTAGIALDVAGLSFDQLAYVIRLCNDFSLTAKYKLTTPLPVSDKVKHVPGIKNILMATYLPRAHNLKADDLETILSCEDKDKFKVENDYIGFDSWNMKVESIDNNTAFFEVTVDDALNFAKKKKPEEPA